MKTTMLKAGDRVKLSNRDGFTVWADGLGTDGKIMAPEGWFKTPPAGAKVHVSEEGRIAHHAQLGRLRIVDLAMMNDLMGKSPKGGDVKLERSEFLWQRVDGVAARIFRFDDRFVFIDERYAKTIEAAGCDLYAKSDCNMFGIVRARDGEHVGLVMAIVVHTGGRDLTPEAKLGKLWQDVLHAARAAEEDTGVVSPALLSLRHAATAEVR